MTRRAPLLLLLLLLAELALPSLARAAVSDPFPGVRLVQRGGAAMTIANLCSPGVNVRASKYSERQATPRQFAEGVGAQVAINADFFDFPGWSYVLVRARGGGEDWPASAQLIEQPSSYWKFGIGTADFEGNSLVPPGPVPWVTDVVGAYDWLIQNGAIHDFTGEPFMLASYRRSAIGLSANRRTLYFYASAVPINGPGMAAEMVSMAAEAGAAPIDIATNQDGGGSSQLYVQGMGQIIDSGRQVNTSLAIYAGGSGPAWHCNNSPPRGTLDAVSCDGVSGWAQDLNAPAAPIDVHVYFGGPAGSGAPARPARAGARRDDLCAALGSCEHAFAMPAPLSLFDGQPHPVHAYGIDTEGGNNPELANSPGTLTCSQPPPAGVRRHIIDVASWVAWGFDLFYDAQSLTETEVAALPLGAPLPASPQLVNVVGDPAIYLVDGARRRHVPDPQTAALWHLDLGSARAITAAELAAMPEGPPLPGRPWVVRATAPGLWVMDVEGDRPDSTRPLAPGVSTAAAPGEPPAPAPAPGHTAITIVGGCTATVGAPLLPLLLLLGLRRPRATRRAR